MPKSRNILQRKKKTKSESEITGRETQLCKKVKTEEILNRDLSLVLLATGRNRPGAGGPALKLTRLQPLEPGHGSCKALSYSGLKGDLGAAAPAARQVQNERFLTEAPKLSSRNGGVCTSRGNARPYISPPSLQERPQPLFLCFLNTS